LCVGRGAAALIMNCFRSKINPQLPLLLLLCAPWSFDAVAGAVSDFQILIKHDIQYQPGGININSLYLDFVPLLLLYRKSAFCSTLRRNGFVGVIFKLLK